MATCSVPKFRIVRCPKCWRLLTEFADIPLYTCGGCSVILQSKKCNGDKGSSIDSLLETDPILPNEPENEDGEQITSSNQTSTCSTDTKCGNGPVESTDCGKNMSGCRRNSCKFPTSGELDSHTKEAVAEAGEESDCAEGKNLNLDFPVTDGQFGLRGVQGWVMNWKELKRPPTTMLQIESFQNLPQSKVSIAVMAVLLLMVMTWVIMS